MKRPWEEILKVRLPLYGHRNWVVIADSAYPAQSCQAIETIVADEEQMTVVGRVFAILRGCKHVQPIVYTDKELKFVHDRDAPGVGSYREKLDGILSGHEIRVLPHDEIISMLDRVGERFRVLLIKTNMRIPYTSVFLKLECGYWNPEAEKRLRAAVRSDDRKRRSIKPLRKR